MNRRFLHFLLGATLFLNLFFASVTGAILGIYISYHGLRDIPSVSENSKQTIPELIDLFENKYAKVYDLKINGYNHLEGTIDAHEDVFLEGYFHPETAEFIGPLILDPPLIKTVTSFHRSLLVGDIGRAIMLITALLTGFLAITGLFLWLKKYSNVQILKNSFYTERKSNLVHGHGGFMALIPILLLCLSGVILSLEGFGLIDDQFNHNVKSKTDKNYQLVSNLKEIYFPFTEDIGEVYEVKTKNYQYKLTIQNKKIQSEIISSRFDKITMWSKSIHTGKSSSIWSFTLTATAILSIYFIISGFNFSKWRWKIKLKKPHSYQILYASENGSTTQIAYSFARQLKRQNIKVKVIALNSFKFHEGIKHIWIFAATYGNGEAPENGSDFEKAFLTIPEKAKITYSVVGFGSKFYPKFCQFAKDIDSRLQLQTWAIKKTDLHLINQRSKSEYIIFLKDCYRSIKLDFPKIIDWPSWD